MTYDAVEFIVTEVPPDKSGAVAQVLRRFSFYSGLRQRPDYITTGTLALAIFQPSFSGPKMPPKPSGRSAQRPRCITGATPWRMNGRSLGHWWRQHNDH